MNVEIAHKIPQSLSGLTTIFRHASNLRYLLDDREKVQQQKRTLDEIESGYWLLFHDELHFLYRVDCILYKVDNFPLEHVQRRSLDGF